MRSEDLSVKKKHTPLDSVALMAAVQAEVGRQEGALSDASRELTVDQIISRLAELTPRSVEPHRAASGSTASPLAQAPYWEPLRGSIPTKPSYALSELLGFHDEAFIEVAYRVIFRRKPDPGGRNYFLQRLRTGTAGKVEILGEMRFSGEGMRNGVHIDGLLIPFRLQQWSRKRAVGPVLRWMHAMFRLGRLPHQQARLEAQQGYEASRLGGLLNKLAEAHRGLVQSAHALESSQVAQDSRMDALDARDASLRQLIGSVESNQIAQDSRMDALDARDASLLQLIGSVESSQVAQDSRMDELEARDASLRQLIGSVDSLTSSLQAKAVELEVMLTQSLARESALELQIGELQARASELADRAVNLEEQWNSETEHRSAEVAEAAVAAKQIESLYSAFEDAFRGSRESVMIKVEPYVAWMRECGAGSVNSPILDVGCGRGEWLELVREQGWIGRGIDLNSEFVDRCRSIGLDVVQAEAIQYLRGIPDGAIGAITSMHLAEHLAFADLLALIDESLRVLRPGGTLVLETPNPENLLVGAHWFYLDFTHRNPLPPLSLRWLVEQRGFADARIERISYGRSLQVPELVPAGSASAAEINYLLDQVSVPVDYAIVARKAP